MTNTQQDDYLLRSEVRKMIGKRINGTKDKNLFDALSNAFYLDFLKELLSELDKLPSGWIPVTERLPDEGESVLVSLQGILYMAYYYPEKIGNQWYFGGSYIDTPNFWMPLPPHP